jgi:hypothetical protein
METEEARVLRQGRFAEQIIGQPEWSELLTGVSDTIVRDWMQGASVEVRELAHAKITALGLVNGLIKTWADRKLSQEIQAAQEQGTSTL